MGTILDRVTMAQRVAQPQTDQPAPPPVSVEQLAGAVRDFLMRNIPGALTATVTKLASIDAEKGLWETEADVEVPNATVKALGLPTRRPVIDTATYLLRLDAHLSILAYGLKDSVDA